MKKTITLFISLYFCISIYAQNNDAATALVVCNDPPLTANPSGTGIDDFADPDNHIGCNGPEVSSMWLYFKMDDATPPGTQLGFIINPTAGFPVDYDWAIYGPDVNCGALGDPIRCSSSSGMCGFCPQTGLGMGAMDVTEGPGTGDGFLMLLSVQGGEGYYLFLENYTNNNTGFTLNFMEGAEYLDCAASPPCCINITTTNDVVVCAGANPFQISATATANGPITYSWEGTGMGTSYLDDPEIQSPTVTIPPDFSGTITYTVTASDGNCDIQDIIIVTVNPKPQVMINPVGIICTNGGNVQMTGTPSNGVWGGIANPAGLINPFTLSAGTYNVTLSSTNQFGCSGSDEIEVEVAEPEEIIIEEVDPLCIDAGPVQLIATPPGGVWSGPVEGGEYFNPGNNGVGIYSLKYTYVTPEGCTSKDSIIIEVVPKPDVFISDPGNLCSDEIIHNLDGNPLGGNWSGVADPTGSIYPKNLGKGSFVVKYDFTDQYGCSNSDSIIIDIEAAPAVSLDPQTEICNSVNSGKSTIVDFNTLILSGDNSGTWTDDDNSGASGSFPVLDFDNIPAGIYEFTYTIKSVSGACPDLIKTVEITVIDCSCPNVSLNGPVDLCNTSNTIDLNTYKNTTEAGSWTLTSVPPGSNPATLSGSTLNISGKDQGLYIATYTLSTVPPVNCPPSNELKINLYAPPTASIPATINLCNKSSSQFPSLVNLYSIITSGDKSGTWVDDENSGASGNFNSLDFTGVPAGTYTFTYTTGSAVAPCTESSYSVDIIVDDCNCPSTVIDPAPDLCSSSGSIDLSSLSTNAAPGTWSITTKPAGTNPASLSANNFITNSSDPGIYTITYTLNPAPPAGCPSSVKIDINVINETFAQLAGSAKVCNSGIISPDSTKLDFSGFIISGDKSGSWVDKDNSGASGSFPNLDFSGVTPGNYTFEYTTANAQPPCTNKTYSMTIIVKDCNCPDLSIVPNTDLCNDITPYNLNLLKLTTESGTWSVISTPGGSNPAIISSNNLDVFKKDPGLYVLQFTASNTPPAGCPVFSQTNITINKAPSGGKALNLDLCTGTKSTIILSDQLSGEDQNGNWSLDPFSSNDPGNAFDPVTGTLTSDNLLSGTYSFNYDLKATPPCSDVTNTVSITVNPKFGFNAGADETFDCSVKSVTLGKTINLPLGYQINWSGPGITNPPDPNPDVSLPGLYIASITTDKNCVSSDSLTVTVLGKPITDLEVKTQDVSCPQAQNGLIEVLNISGGTPAYTYIWNGSLQTSDQTYDSLSIGTYTLQVKDQLGCFFDSVFTINSKSGFTLDLGPDLVLDQGQDYSITAIINIAPNLVDSIIWSPAVCVNCIQINEIAETDLTYKVHAIDINGCIATDEVNISVSPVRNVFIPNVFSPNGDGINDIFFIRSGVGVSEIEALEIFDRWGARVFHIEHFLPNDPVFGWNGKMNEKLVNNNVFVYWARIKFNDGETFIYKGDITINK